MSSLWWNLRERGLAWPALAALGLLVFTLVMHVLIMPGLQAELEAIAARPAAAPPPVSAQPPDPAEQLLSFYQHFDGGGPLAAQLKTLHRVAIDHGVAMPQGDYRMLQGRDSPLRQYQITLPVHGTYPDVRRFVAEVLTEMPVAALDEVTFERRNIGDAAVQARVQFTLFLPGPAP